MKTIVKSIVISTLPFALGCISAPKQTVELAEIVNQQIVSMQTSHEKFVALYYDKLRREVDNFMQQKWIPQFLSNVIEGTGEDSRQFRQDLDMAYKLSNVDWEQVISIEGIEDDEVKNAIRDAIAKLSSQEKASLGNVLLEFSKAIQEQIIKQRELLIQPIDAQETLVLEQLRSGYADVQRGNASIKGYLSSAVKLVEDRDATLERLGVLEEQRKIVDTAVSLSEGASRALKTVENADDAISNFLDEIKKTNADINDIINEEDN